MGVSILLLLGLIFPVGRPFYDSKGKLVSDLILGLDGEGVPGLQLAFHGWDAHSQQPLPFYLTTDNQWAAMYVDESNRLVHGLARDPKTNQVKPVGLQAVDNYGRPIRDTIVGPDGRTTLGIPLTVIEDDNVTTASSPRGQMSVTTAATMSTVTTGYHPPQVQSSATTTTTSPQVQTSTTTVTPGVTTSYVSGTYLNWTQ